MKSNLAQTLAQTGGFLVSQGLAWGKSGNLSGRVDEELMLISASGCGMGGMQPDDLVPVRFLDESWEGDRKPSKEVPMHAAIYAERSDAQAVLHSSPPYATLLACSSVELPSGFFIESMYYLERVAWVDYAPPGSKELGDGVRRAASSAEVIVLRNHGVVVFDVSVEEAVMRLQTLELAAQMVVTARSAGIALRAIPPDDVSAFLRSGRYKPRRAWH